MEPTEALSERRRRIIEDHGQWVGYNLDLGPGGYTIGRGQVGLAERMLQQITQIVADHAGTLAGLRVLDLGSHEGGYSIALAQQGALVTSVESRSAHIAKARFAADALRIGDKITVIQDDIRNVDVDRFGEFDVVLCLGVLYHLEAHDAAALCQHMRAMCRFTVIRTAVALRTAGRVRIGDHVYRGLVYDENPGTQPGASIDNPSSFFFTQASLLNLLADSGFTSVTQVVQPHIGESERMAGTTTVVAFSGEQLEPTFLPEISRLPAARVKERRLPEGLTKVAHPQQGWVWRLRDRATGEFARMTFSKRKQLDH